MFSKILLQMNHYTKSSPVRVVFTKFRWFWVVLAGFGLFWLVVWVVLAGGGWFWLVVGGFLAGCMFYN